MILVTGGTGFQGAYLLYYLLDRYKKVRATRRSSSNLTELHNIFTWLDAFGEGTGAQEKLQRIEWAEADMLDYDALTSAFEGVTEVYHCAAMVSFAGADRQKMLDVNITGTAFMVDLALQHGVKKLGYISSIAALKKEQGKLITEQDRYQDLQFPNTYAESKYYSEMEVWRGVAEGLDAVIVNPGVILGPGDFTKGSSKLFERVYQGLKYYTHGGTGYVDARDVALALIQLMQSDKKNRGYLLVAENLTYKNLLQKMADCLGVNQPGIGAGKVLSEVVWRLAMVKGVVTRSRPLITKSLARAAQNNYTFSSQRIKNEIAFEFRPIEKTIQDTCEVFLGEKGGG